jgi:pimeloyl-ACP methyl ester carboxylesterase
MEGTTIEDISDIDLRVNDRRRLSVRLLRVNPPTETTIFLIHGSMASLSQFNRLIEKLKLFAFNIVAYDAYGCGNSDKPHDYAAYSTQELTNDLIAVYEKYSTARNILIGHSFGTSEVARLCKYVKTYGANSNQAGDASPRNLKAIDAVVLLATTYHAEDGGHPIFRLPVWMLKCLSGYLARQFAAMAYSPSVDEAIKQESLALSSSNDMYVVKAFYQQMKWAKKDDWAAVNFYPLLILHGADDMILPVQGAETLVHELQDLRHDEKASDVNINSTARLNQNIKFNIIENCGHQIMIEKTDEAFEIIKQFLVTSNILSERIVIADIEAYWNQANNDDVQLEFSSSEVEEQQSLVVN